jgi:hypothetical protein
MDAPAAAGTAGEDGACTPTASREPQAAGRSRRRDVEADQAHEHGDGEALPSPVALCCCHPAQFVCPTASATCRGSTSRPGAREYPALRRPTSCLCAGGPARRGLSVRRTTPLVGPSERATVGHATRGVAAYRSSGGESGLRGGTATAASYQRRVRPTSGFAARCSESQPGGEPTEGGLGSQGREAVSKKGRCRCCLHTPPPSTPPATRLLQRLATPTGCVLAALGTRPMAPLTAQVSLAGPRLNRGGSDQWDGCRRRTSG